MPSGIAGIALQVIAALRSGCFMPRKKRKPIVAIAGFLFSFFVIGYFVGKATSWTDKETAFWYLAGASHRVAPNSSDGALLEAPAPHATYRFYRDGVISIPNDNFVAQRPQTIAENYFDQWMKTIAVAGTGFAAKAIWDCMVDPPTWKSVLKIAERNKALLAVLSVGSFTGGFFLGHGFGPDFDDPEFRKALLDKNVWKDVWAYKLNLLEAESDLEIASANRAVLKYGDYIYDPELSPTEITNTMDRRARPKEYVVAVIPE
jgi:hypothetical protein